MPLQPFEPITSTFDGPEVEPTKGYTKKSVLEGPIITAEWTVTGLVIVATLEYHLTQYVSNKLAYEQLTEAITQSKNAQTNLEAQIVALRVVEARANEVITVRKELYEAGGFTKPLYAEYLTAVEGYEQVLAAIEAIKAAVTQAASERAKLIRERAEFGLADAKDALRRSEFPLLITARLLFEGNVIWTATLPTQRLLLKQTARMLAEASGGDYTGVQGLYQERIGARYDIGGELTPGKPLHLELEVLGPVGPEGPDLEGPEIAAGATLSAIAEAEYEPQPALAVN
jgi:hypothetical protein